MATYLPETQIWIAAVIDAQATMNTNDFAVFTPCLAGLIHSSVERRGAHKESHEMKHSESHDGEIIAPQVNGTLGQIKINPKGFS
ncbi:MAG: hypothetical protein ACLGSD_10460 [Acidobacteriota bacterium]